VIRGAAGKSDIAFFTWHSFRFSTDGSDRQSSLAKAAVDIKLIKTNRCLIILTFKSLVAATLSSVFAPGAEGSP
jgi:hypothetical protein